MGTPNVKAYLQTRVGHVGITTRTDFSVGYEEITWMEMAHEHVHCWLFIVSGVSPSHFAATVVIPQICYWLLSTCLSVSRMAAGTGSGDSFFTHCVRIGCGAHATSCSVGAGTFPPQAWKWPLRAVCAEVKDVWMCTSKPWCWGLFTQQIVQTVQKFSAGL